MGRVPGGTQQCRDFPLQRSGLIARSAVAAISRCWAVPANEIYDTGSDAPSNRRESLQNETIQAMRIGAFKHGLIENERQQHHAFMLADA